MSTELEQHAQARIGTTLHGKYRLEGLIGSGGMAAVYLAVHRNGHRVAIKMLHPHLSIDAELRARFLREGYLANKVDHRGAVRVLDDDKAEDGSVFLVMELLQGETLDRRWKRHDLRSPVREVCQLAWQLLDVLGAAHRQGVVHRDIKPENLFLTTDGVLKVLDFGIARLVESTAGQSATRTGRMIGTPAFMPPEQALGRSRQIDAQTDLWAVGATMFTLLSGRFVHEAETVEEMLIFAGSRPARPVSSVAPEVPPPIARVIDGALTFAKEQRWRDASAMASALDDAYRLCFGTPLGSAAQPGPATGAEDPAFARTAAMVEVQAATGPVVSSGADGPPRALSQPDGAQGPSAPPALAPPGPPGRGVSTTGGIASARAAPSARPRKVKAVLAGVAAATIAVVGLGAAVLHRGAGTTAPAAQAASAVAIKPLPVEPPPSAAPIATLDPGSAPSASTPSATTAPTRSRAPVAAAPAASIAAPAQPAAHGVAPAKNSCDPPYFIDAAGHRRYKPECL